MRFLGRLLLLVVCFSPLLSQAQDSSKTAVKEVWDNYIARLSKGVGSVNYNASIKEKAPNPRLPFLVITGVTLKSNDGRNLPDADELNYLYVMSDTVFGTIKKHTKMSAYVGSLAYNKERYDYFYVSDTLFLKDRLEETYHNNYKYYKSHIKVKRDEEWNGYFTFLYPSAEVLEFKQNHEIITKLLQAGDNLDKPRSVNHFFSFKEITDREYFEKVIEAQQFKIVTKMFNRDDLEYPFRLCVSREDRVDEDTMNGITVQLRKLATRNGGRYDFWQTQVTK
ncbi:regulator of ribonuclease activity B [Chitinophaga skermanii]|uniref:Regulator of ribonuclease activity B n=1 Tax=Chitinophaga skermanii TaxID=331697 RepID=A0A327QK30_9BACT|nr:DUF695 domain-containing protein [Chitinophaga skermanii]RAJ04042.1 regulator of ribonuclease activity B [Chitinophaga skermanii]